MKANEVMRIGRSLVRAAGQPERQFVVADAKGSEVTLVSGGRRSPRRRPSRAFYRLRFCGFSFVLQVGRRQNAYVQQHCSCWSSDISTGSLRFSVAAKIMLATAETMSDEPTSPILTRRRESLHA